MPRGTTPSSSETPRRARAVALRYEPPRERAPRVVAKGEGLLAEAIVARARAARVPVHADPALASALGKIPLEAEIPPELYRAVAAVLAFFYRLGVAEDAPRGVDTDRAP